MELPSFPDEYALMDAYILVFSVDSRARLALIVSLAHIFTIEQLQGHGPDFPETSRPVRQAQVCMLHLERTDAHCSGCRSFLWEIRPILRDGKSFIGEQRLTHECREISIEEGQQLAKSYNAVYIETSAKTKLVRRNY